MRSATRPRRDDDARESRLPDHPGCRFLAEQHRRRDPECRRPRLAHTPAGRLVRGAGDTRPCRRRQGGALSGHAQSRLHPRRRRLGWRHLRQIVQAPPLADVHIVATLAFRPQAANRDRRAYDRGTAGKLCPSLNAASCAKCWPHGANLTRRAEWFLSRDSPQASVLQAGRL